jgi:predicted O-methyltransferase YrrM
VIGPFERSTSVARGVRQIAYVAQLPGPAARFYVRALATALRRGDRRSLVGSTRPRELAALLHAAEGHRRVVELGTGTAWTTIALLLADRERRVATYDPADYEERQWYLERLDSHARSRLEILTRADDQPADDAFTPDLVFIDSSHERDQTISAFRTWEPRLPPGGVVAFHDYGDPAWPGVDDAIRALGLDGQAAGFLFMWTKPS